MGTTDELIDAEVVAGLRRTLRQHDTREWSALAAIGAELPDQPLRRRVDLVRDALVADVGADFGVLARVLDRALGDPELRGWAIWPVTEAVAELAVAGDAFEEGLELLRRLTGRLSAEFALRTFLEADAERTLAVVRGWCADEDEHVRRLASEGTRSFLPWGRQVPALHARPALTVPVLDALRRDESAYVRRSVANHLNDLSRRHPDLAAEVGARWLADPDENTAALVRHAFRTLVKAGHPGALAALGFGGAADVAGPCLDRTVVRVGEELVVRAAVTNVGAERTRFAVDYVVHYRKARGGLAPKVFKLATVTLAPGESRELVTRRSFAPTTTRALHLGGHRVELQVNGQRYGDAGFELLAGAER